MEALIASPYLSTTSISILIYWLICTSWTSAYYPSRAENITYDYDLLQTFKVLLVTVLII